MLLGAFGRHHNNERKIVHTRSASETWGYRDCSKILLIGEEMVELYWKSAPHFLGCGWVFGFRAAPNGGFGHQHNRQNIEHARKSTGKIRQKELSKKC